MCNCILSKGSAFASSFTRRSLFVSFVAFLMISSMAKTSRAAAAATTILCFGDSWTYGNSYGIQEQLKARGHSNINVVTKDFWGSTAQYFAENPRLLPDAVSKHKANYVLLSMGGNDFKNIYLRQRQYVTPWTAVSAIEKNIRIVLDELFKVHPDVKVVTYGYDFPGSVDKFLSEGTWVDTSSMKALLWVYNLFGVRFINYSAMQLGYALEKLSKEYIAKGHSFTYVPLWGSLQQAADAKKVLSPSLGQPSRSEFMNDPIHANHKGYGILMGNLYNSYFTKALEQVA